MVQRLTYRRRHPYHNRSNRTRIVKTPGATRFTTLYECKIMHLLAEGSK